MQQLNKCQVLIKIFVLSFRYILLHVHVLLISRQQILHNVHTMHVNCTQLICSP